MQSHYKTKLSVQAGDSEPKMGTRAVGPTDGSDNIEGAKDRRNKRAQTTLIWEIGTYLDCLTVHAYIMRSLYYRPAPKKLKLLSRPIAI